MKTNLFLPKENVNVISSKRNNLKKKYASQKSAIIRILNISGTLFSLHQNTSIRAGKMQY